MESERKEKEDEEKKIESEREQKEEKERRIENERKQKENEIKVREANRKKDELVKLANEKRRLERLQSKQFSDIESGQSIRDYNKWIKKVKSMFFNKTQANVLFSKYYEMSIFPTEWAKSPNMESYSLHQILTAFSSMDQLTVMLLNCDNLIEDEFYINNNGFHPSLFGFDKSNNRISQVPTDHNNKTYLGVNDGSTINMMEYLMRKERIPLYSLVDTIVSFNNEYYGDKNLGIELRNNSNVNEDLVKRLIKARDNEQCNTIYICGKPLKNKELSLKNKGQKQSKNDDELPF